MSRLAAALLLVLICLAAPAWAAVPYPPPYSTVDAILVGNSSGADMGNGFRVIVRDVGRIPLAGDYVTFYFVTSSSRPYAQQNDGATGDCALGTLRQISDGQGQTVFHARIAGFDNTQTVELRVKGILFGKFPVRSTDIDGNGATDLRDVNAFRQRFVFDIAAPETDFNLDGVTNGYDFDLLRDEFVRGVKGTVCP